MVGTVLITTESRISISSIQDHIRMLQFPGYKAVLMKEKIGGGKLKSAWKLGRFWRNISKEFWNVDAGLN